MRENNIIIIEDDYDVREFVSTFLTEQGYNITEVENGAFAKETIEDKRPDLVICDLLLPGEHGLDIIKFIRKKYSIPVIIISGIYSFTEIKEDLKELSIEGFLDKPIDTNKLLETITKTIGKKN